MRRILVLLAFLTALTACKTSKVKSRAVPTPINTTNIMLSWTWAPTVFTVQSNLFPFKAPWLSITNTTRTNVTLRLAGPTGNYRLMVTNGAPAHAIVTWDTNSAPAYIVWWGESANSLTNWWTVPRPPFVISNLVAGHTYHVAVESIGGAQQISNRVGTNWIARPELKIKR